MANELMTVNKVKSLLCTNSEIQERIKAMMDNSAQSFITSVLNVVSSNTALQQAEPLSIVKAAMISASLKLTIDPNLGFSAIVPYGKEAQFQIMYKGLTQLAIRSGLYETINVAEVYEDEFESYNPFTGEVKFTPQENWKQRYQIDSTVVGYFAYFKLLTGFQKACYMTKEEVEKHAVTYSKSYQYDKKQNKKASRWSIDFDAMGRKTVLKMLLSKYGILSVEMQKALTFDQARIGGDIENPEPEYTDNPEYIDVKAENPFEETKQLTDKELGDYNAKLDLELANETN